MHLFAISTKIVWLVFNIETITTSYYSNIDHLHLTHDQYEIPDENGNLKVVNKSKIWETIKSTLSSFDAEKEVGIYLYTKSKPSGQKIIFNDTSSLFKSDFDVRHKIRILIDGYLTDYNNSVVKGYLKDAYLRNGDCNVFYIDWSKGSNTINYIVAAIIRVPQVGKFVGEFVNFLVNSGNASYCDIYLLGLSLGAHIAGIAGKTTTQKVSTIFGMDPAGPLFSINFPHKRLSVGDAEYVEVIHTNCGTLGFCEPLGDADFYMNGGKLQSGCPWGIKGITCSHLRPPEYLAESLSSKDGFWAFRCTMDDINNSKCRFDKADRVKMGGEPSNSKDGVRGVFFLKTKDRAPYALGKQ